MAALHNEVSKIILPKIGINLCLKYLPNKICLSHRNIYTQFLMTKRDLHSCYVCSFSAKVMQNYQVRDLYRRF